MRDHPYHLSWVRFFRLFMRLIFIIVGNFGLVR